MKGSGMKALLKKILKTNAFAVLVLLVVSLGGTGSVFAAEPVFPALSGQIVDRAHMLSVAQENNILQKLQALEGKSSDQFVLVTLKNLQGYSIEDFGVRLARHWGIGRKDKNNGILLIIAPKERKVRIEVGYGLEGVMTDTLAGNIVHNRILPLFRRGKMVKGISTGVDDIIGVLTGDAGEVALRAKGRQRRKGQTDWLGLWVFAVWLMIFLGVLSKSLFGRKARRGGIVIVPVPMETTGHWHGGGGGFGGGGFGGGGFGGGGGGFGGGGASGGW